MITLPIRFSSKSGKVFEVRKLEITDSEELTEYINTLSAEKTFIRTQGRQYTLEEETEVVTGWINQMEKGNGFWLCCTHEGRIIGLGSVEKMNGAEAHVVNFAISVAIGCRADGIGRKLMTTLLELAEQSLSGVKILNLSVFANNSNAIKLYTSLGFKQYGVLPNGILHRGEYVDHLYLYKEVVS